MPQYILREFKVTDARVSFSNIITNLIKVFVSFKKMSDDLFRNILI